jgi:hypothetical protein
MLFQLVSFRERTSVVFCHKNTPDDEHHEENEKKMEILNNVFESNYCR